MVMVLGVDWHNASIAALQHYSKCSMCAGFQSRELRLICATSRRTVTAVTGIISARKESIIWKKRGTSGPFRKMETLPEVETAKALMTEAMTWSVMT
jgi:recombinational DNA repair protein RecR